MENRPLRFRMRFLILFVVALSALLLGINSEAAVKLDLFQNAASLYNQARFPEAINLYQEIIKNNPKELKAYLNLAYLYKDLLEYKQGIEILEKAIKSFKDDQLKILVARFYHLNGKPEQAISQLKQLLPLCPGNSDVLFYLGLCYEDIGKLTEAEAFYLDAIKLKPNSVLAYLKLGNIYYQSQRLQEAVGAYKKVISLDPSSPGVRHRLAECFTGLGEFSSAYREYAKSIAVEPENELLQKGLEEIKIKLGEDFFKKEKKLASQRRRAKSIQVRAFPVAQNVPQVRVGIARIKHAIEFKCGSPFLIIDQQSDKSLFGGREEVVYSLVFNKKASIQLKDYQGNILLLGLNSPFLIKNKPRPCAQERGKSKSSVVTIFDLFSGEGNFWAGWYDQQYRGIIEVVPDSNGFQLINLVNLEEYLYSVLPSEMPVNWPKQALLTQAIAARTWAMRNKTRHNHQGFNFCNTVHCQVYKGARAETQLTNQAVDKTAGRILISANQPIDIFYSNNCGGHTRDGVVDAVSLDFHFPLSPLELEIWLMSSPDTFCNLEEERAANFRWVRLYKQEELQAMLAKSRIDIEGAVKIIPQRRTTSGHLASIKIKGAKNSRVIEGENNIRKILGNLFSSAFKIETRFNQAHQPVEFIFYGAGFGHGRGLCQSGIKGMALEGYNHLEILKHYYPDTQIKKIY